MAAERPGLAALLANYRQNTLVVLASAHGLAGDGRPNRDQAVAALVARLKAPKGIADRRAELDPAARAALDLVHQAGGRIARPDLVALLVEDGVATAAETARPKYGYGGPELVPGQLSRPGGRAAQDVLARLEASGLALGQGPAGSGSVVDLGTAREYVIPAEVWAALPDPPPWPTGELPAVAREAPGDPAAASRGLFFLWAHLARTRPALLLTGRLGKRDLKGAALALGLDADVGAVKDETELAWLYLARLTLQNLGLLAGAPGEALTADAAQARLFWALPLADRVVRLVDAYLDVALFNELRYLAGTTWVPAVRAELHEASPAAHGARLWVQSVVAEVGAAGGWAAMATLMRAIRVRHRDFLVKAGMPARGRYGYWREPAHRYDATGNTRGYDFSGIRDEAAGWQKVEGGFVAQVLGVLGRLGLVDLGLGAKGEALTFRLTPWGRHALLDEPAPADEAPAGMRLVVQPNFQVVAMGPVPELTLLDLEQFADRVSADRAVTYALSRASVYRGQQVGWDGERVVAWLAESSGAALPQNVERSVREWQGLHERIVVKHGVRLIQVREPGLLDRLLAQVPGAERLAPGLALVAEGLVPAVERALVGLGESPWRLAPGAVPPAAVALDEAGRVTLAHKTPDLFTVGSLQRLAEPEGADWRVTAGSARRAHERLGLTAEDQLARWTALCGTVPEGLAARLKAWTGHYGAAKRLAGVVLELPSAEVLDDLRAHADLRAALQPVRAAGPLVSIRAADYPRIAARLRELGLDLPEPGPGE